MATGADRWARALSAGLRPFALCYATATLVLGWLGTAEALLPALGAEGVLLPGAGILLTVAGGLLLAVRVRRLRRLLVAGCLIAMLAGYAVYLGTVRQGSIADHDTAAFGPSFVKVAIVVYLANAGRRWAPIVLAAVAVVALEAWSALVGPSLGYPWAIDGPELVWLGVVVAATFAVATSRRRSAVAAATFAQAESEEALRRTRGLARSQAAAVVHDTVLNDLAVLATSPPGRLPDRLVGRLAATLELLGSPDWVSGTAAGECGAGTALHDAVESATQEGLDVRLEGDLDALAGLDPAVEQALAAAVAQCLVNTGRHSGASTAEVTVLAGDGELSVMIADAGAGFDTAQIDDDRLGLRGSVQGRIEDAGGSVRIFSRPGFGTTVLLSVPAALAPATDPR